MFGSEILDVAIGVALVFLMMSFLATAIREAIESVVKARAVYLERGIRQLLDDVEGNGIAQAFYEHPLIFSLFQGDYNPKDRRFLGRALPSYVPARNFDGCVIPEACRDSEPGARESARIPVAVVSGDDGLDAKAVGCPLEQLT